MIDLDRCHTRMRTHTYVSARGPDVLQGGGGDGGGGGSCTDREPFVNALIL